MATAEAVVLLGWMSRDEAIQYLRDECVFDPPLTEHAAELLWRPFHQAVEVIENRLATAPDRLELSGEEREAADRFLDHFRGRNNILDVVKVDPTRLVARQLYVTVERAQRWRVDHTDLRSWCETCIPLPTASDPQYNLSIEAGLNSMNIELPHAEFGFAFDPQHGFQIPEFCKHVGVTEFGDRMMLFAGYHRAYECLANIKTLGKQRSLLAALSADADILLSPSAPDQRLRAMLSGPRPALLGDFLDEHFGARLRVRKKQYQLQIRARVVGINMQ